MTYEQRLTELGFKTYAQPAIDGSYMGSASCDTGMSAFAGAPTREAGFMRLWTDLMVGRILRTASEGSPLNFTSDPLWKSRVSGVGWLPGGLSVPAIRFERIAFTGHRPDKLPGGYEHARLPSVRLAALLYGLDPKHVISGMALGVDQLAAEAAVAAAVPFHAYIPFEGQEKRWPAASQQRYRELLKSARVTRVVSPTASPKAFDLRNRAMVDDCDLLIAVWDGSSGGTANCVEYAQRVLRPTLFLKPGFVVGEP